MKFDQLLCMNKVSNSPSMQDVYSLCASPMHASVDCPCIGKFDCVTEQVDVVQGFPLSNNPYFGGIILIFHRGLKILRIRRPGLVDLPLLVFNTRDMLLLLPIQLHLGAPKLVR